MIATTINRRYARARAKIDRFRVRFERYRAIEARTSVPERAGRAGAGREIAGWHWNRALGAAAELEALADELGVTLEHDRRRHVPRHLL